MFVFEHERLDAYRLAREFNRAVYRLTRLSRKGWHDHIDQQVRAAASILRNIAEGAGEWSPKEKAKFFRYAKRSADECAAILDTLVDYQMLRENEIEEAKELLGRIISMLIRLIKLFEAGGSAKHGVTKARKGTGTGT